MFTRLLYFIGLCYYHEGETSECCRFMGLALRYKPAPEILPDVYVSAPHTFACHVGHAHPHGSSSCCNGELGRFYHIGLCCALESRNIDAIESFTAALERSSALSASATPSMQAQLFETQLVYVHERAKALQLEAYYDEAIADFSFVLQHNPNNAHACFRRGFAHKALGNLAAAAADFETAKLLDPTNLQLVVNYRELGDTECVILCDPGQERAY